MKLKHTSLTITLITLLMLSCSMSLQLTDPTPTFLPPTDLPPSPAPPEPVETPTAVFTPLPTIAPIPAQSDQPAVQIVTQPVRFESASPYYIIDGSRPELRNGGAAGDTFNTLVQRMLDDQTNSFVAGLADVEAWRAENMPDVPSTMNISYSIELNQQGVISILFNIDTYVAGAAHPFPFSLTLNYDLSRGRELALADLFTPGADYLGRISTLCKDDLSTREYIDFLDGAEASLENYRSWNITPGGLLINFDVYQVAPYAAGPQSVLLPYYQLEDLIHETSPLYNLPR